MFINPKSIPKILRLTPDEIQKIIESKVADLREHFATSNYHRTAVIGLSGGIDSALSATLAALALGPENVIAARLPFRTCNEKSNHIAEEIAGAIGLSSANLFTVDITQAVDATLRSTAGILGGDEKIRVGNAAARERMKVLMDVCTAYKALLIGTENRTEELLAYFTIGGDSISHIEPIQDLWKTQVFQLAAAIKTPTGQHLPKSVLDRAPSAELWEGQTDEGELDFTYLAADMVLALTEEGKNPRQIVKEAAIPFATVNKVLKRVKITKRKRHAPYRIKTL
ncbi:MAG: NAD(+) synthase [Patescibacteria group bacterium]